MDYRRRARELTAVGLLFVGCDLAVGSSAGKVCETVADCPEPYSCVAARLGQGRTCELLLPPRVGTGVGEPPASYCEIEDALQRTCVANCHGADTVGSGRADFRLDYYEPADAGLPGAKEMAVRVGTRVADLSMPPAGSPQPTDEERDLIRRWVNADAPLSVDGGTCSTAVGG